MRKLVFGLIVFLSLISIRSFAAVDELDGDEVEATDLYFEKRPDGKIGVNEARKMARKGEVVYRCEKITINPKTGNPSRAKKSKQSFHGPLKGGIEEDRAMETLEGGKKLIRCVQMELVGSKLSKTN